MRKSITVLFIFNYFDYTLNRCNTFSKNKVFILKSDKWSGKTTVAFIITRMTMGRGLQSITSTKSKGETPG